MPNLLIFYILSIFFMPPPRSIERTTYWTSLSLGKDHLDSLPNPSQKVQNPIHHRLIECQERLLQYGWKNAEPQAIGDNKETDRDDIGEGLMDGEVEKALSNAIGNDKQGKKENEPQDQDPNRPGAGRIA